MLDYDADDDGLIEVSSLAQLNAIRWDLDGDGSTTDTSYASAFPNPVSGMGCPSAGCTGYELDADLDFDTNGNGEADSGDDHWNDGSGWAPIGTQSSSFSTTFDGNGHTISGLFINRGSTDDVGLFGRSDSSSVIRNTGLRSVNVTGNDYVGGLIGWKAGGTITASYASGSVTGNDSVGGLVGYNRGTITTSYASGSVTGNNHVGGLVGLSSGGTITASYASGSVTGSGDNYVGGLVGYNRGTITTSYASGSVTGNNYVGGLVGLNFGGTITASYWDSDTSGQTTSAGGIGKTTSQLQAPTGYTGIYAGWNVDIDNADGDDTLSTGGDKPWDFGTASQYPTINYVPSAPVMLSALSGDGQVTLTWATGPSIFPITKYQFQEDGSGQGWQDIPGSDATTTSYTVTGLNNDQSYTFQVRAVNQAGPGEASGSAAATPLGPPDQPVGLRATPGVNSVILDWSAASTDANITKYQFQVEGSGQGWQDIPGSGATTTSYTVTGLNNDQSYTFRVRAVNQAGPGEASDSVAATPTKCANGTAVYNPGANPGLVSDCAALLAARDTLAGTGTLDWSETVAVGAWEGISISGKPRRLVKVNLSRNQLKGSIPAELGRLTKLGWLYLDINQLSGAIPAELSNLNGLAWLVLSGNQLSGAIPAELGSMTNLDTLALNRNQLSGAIPAELGHLTNLQWLLLADNSFSADTCIPNALSGVPQNDFGDTGLSFCGRPAKATNVAAVPGDGEVTLSWGDPGDESITRYQFRGDGSGRGWQVVPGSDAGTTSHTVTGLTNGQRYTFRVRAVNQVGPGRASDSVEATPMGPPDQPMGLTATPDANSVILDWSAASADENITKYQFQEDGSGRGWQDVPGSDASTTSYTVTGLNNDQTYKFRVRAVNRAGPGQASDSVEATPKFLVTISVSDSTPAIGQRITLTANVASGIAVASYQWDRKFGDGTWREDGPPRKSKGVKFDVNRTAVYRAVVTLSTGQTVRSEPVTLTWENR